MTDFVFTSDRNTRVCGTCAVRVCIRVICLRRISVFLFFLFFSRFGREWNQITSRARGWRCAMLFRSTYQNIYRNYSVYCCTCVRIENAWGRPSRTVFFSWYILFILRILCSCIVLGESCFHGGSGTVCALRARWKLFRANENVWITFDVRIVIMLMLMVIINHTRTSPRKLIIFISGDPILVSIINLSNLKTLYAIMGNHIWYTNGI